VPADIMPLEVQGGDYEHVLGLFDADWSDK
jgi:hypothetical protein